MSDEPKKFTITPVVRTMEMRSGPVKMGTPTHEIIEVGHPPIPWQPFEESMRRHVNHGILLLWWVPLRGGVDVFTGRVAYWQAQDCAMVRRGNGSAVAVRAGCYFAVVTAPVIPPGPKVIDDAVEVTASNPATSPAVQPPSGDCGGATPGSSPKDFV